MFVFAGLETRSDEVPQGAEQICRKMHINQNKFFRQNCNLARVPWQIKLKRIFMI